MDHNDVAAFDCLSVVVDARTYRQELAASSGGWAMKFAEGDRVAWSHIVAPEHGEGSVMRWVAVVGRDSEARKGVILGVDNDVATWWNVQLDGEDEPRTLTSDELVKIQD